MSNEQIYKDAAEKLWGLLDDIDTLTDIIKPTTLEGYARFYQAALVRCNRRHLILVSDGYSLHIPKTCAQKIVEENGNVAQQPKIGEDAAVMALNGSPASGV
jgi:hypothetical protein